MLPRKSALVLFLISAIACPGQSPAKQAWFSEAKFGILIHWGLYSIPAGEWKGQMISGPGESIMRNAPIPVQEYEKLANQFKPTRFNAEEWVKWAAESGVKYVIFSAKDDDGFAMYRSAVSKYNVFDATPFHRDPLKELSTACAKDGLKFGVHYSLEQDWDFSPDDGKSFDQYLRRKAEPQLKELETSYTPLGIVSLGPSPTINGPRALAFLDPVHSRQPTALASLGSAGDFQSFDGDHIPSGVLKGTWQVTQSINGSAGFNKYDNVWKPVDHLIFNLVDIVSKGGNYLLNVGPTAEGVIPQPILVTLQQMGDWLKINGEAVYGAGPTPFGNEFNSAANMIKWRCTTKPGKLFFTLFQWPDGPLEIEGIQGRVTKAYLMADASRKPLGVTQEGGRVAVALPKDPPPEFPVPERMNPRLMARITRAQVRCVIVLETRKN